MAVGREGTKWYFMINLPPTDGGKRQGFATEKAARQAETAALNQVRGVQLAVDGTVTAELTRWLGERELDMAVTGLSTYRDYLKAYVFVTGAAGFLGRHLVEAFGPAGLAGGGVLLAQ